MTGGGTDTSTATAQITWLLWLGPGESPEGSRVEGLVLNAAVFRGGALESHWLTRAPISSTHWGVHSWMDYWEVAETVGSGAGCGEGVPWKGGSHPWPLPVSLGFPDAMSWAALLYHAARDVEPLLCYKATGPRDCGRKAQKPWAKVSLSLRFFFFFQVFCQSNGKLADLVTLQRTDLKRGKDRWHFKRKTGAHKTIKERFSRSTWDEPRGWETNGLLL